MNPRDCPFCDKGIAKATLAETEHLRAVCNLAPMFPGHCMILPKRHIARLGDLSPSEAEEVMPFAARMARVVMEVYACTGYDVSLQEGAAAGQTVEHLHLHIIPRRAGDLPDSDWHGRLIDSAQRERLSAEEMASAVSRLRRALATSA